MQDRDPELGDSRVKRGGNWRDADGCGHEGQRQRRRSVRSTHDATKVRANADPERAIAFGQQMVHQVSAAFPVQGVAPDWIFSLRIKIVALGCS